MNLKRRSFLECFGTAILAMTVTSATVFADDKDLTAEVNPKPGKKPKPGKTLPLQVSLLSIGPSEISIGDKIAFQVQANSKAFGHIYILNASGKVSMIAENMKLKANHPRSIPADGLSIRATSPAGMNEVIFVATRTKFNGFANGASTTAPQQLDVSNFSFKSALKSKLGGADNKDWAVAVLSVNVRN